MEIESKVKIEKKFKAGHNDYIQRASELIKFQILLKYLSIIMEGKSAAQGAINKALGVVEGGLKSKCRSKRYMNLAILELLGITEGTREEESN